MLPKKRPKKPIRSEFLTVRFTKDELKQLVAKCLPNELVSECVRRLLLQS